MMSIDKSFLKDFRARTEARWRTLPLNREIYGFQFQPGTRWNPGLSAAQIKEYEAKSGLRFSDEFCLFLSRMNGTDLPTLNVYGGKGEPERQSVGVYAYPKDLAAVRGCAAQFAAQRLKVAAVLKEQGFELKPSDSLVPFYMHRFILCRAGEPAGPVLSVYDADAIVYSDTLRAYLEREFLGG